MAEAEESPAEEPKKGISKSCAILIFSLIVILIVAGLIIYLAPMIFADRLAQKGKDTITGIAEAFRPEEVIESFNVYREAKIEGTEGNILEVAKGEATETFTRKTNLEWFGKSMPLGTTVSEISVPATYRYHIDLNGDWFIQSDGKRLLVMAPKLRPSLPVAFDTAGMQKKTKSGWGRWDGDENLDELEQSLTAKLAVRAGDSESIKKYRDTSRLAVAKFLQTWLLNQDAWADGKFEEIVVRFEDETGGSLMNAKPVLDLKSGTQILPAPVE